MAPMEAVIRQERTDWPAILMMAAGATMISFSSVFVKSTDVGPIAAGFYRSLFGSVVLIPVAFWQRRSFSPGWRCLLLSVGCGALLATDLSVWHKSIHWVGPGLATILSNFQVFVLTAIGALFFRERPPLRSYLSIFIAFGGLTLLVGPNWDQVGPLWHWGVAFGLMTALAYAGYLLLLRHLQTGKDGADQTWNIALVTVATTALMAVETPIFGGSFAILDTRSLWAMIAYGVFSQGVGWYLISKSLPRVDVSAAGLIILLQPALTFLWDMLFFARPTSSLDLMGLCAVLVAIYIGATRSHA